uniref:L-seryl-tRNA(Sec) kinase n=1 Tax=Lygus hesperus TaxID=30085 RepID=A0A0A9XV27_LYGHE
MAVSLLCLVGIPGSGKTTVARAIENYVKGRSGNVVVIEYDSHIDNNVFARGEWKDSRIHLLGKVEKIAEELTKTERKSVVILDDNFYYRSMRYDVYKIAKKFNLGFGQIFLDVPLEVCIRRNMSRTKPLNSETINKMKALLEPPEPSRNSWEAYSVIFSSDGPNLEVIYDLIAETWMNPCCEEPAVVFVPQKNSNVHYADLALRQIIKSIVRNTLPEARADLTRKLAHKKKLILEDIKLMKIALPDSSGSESVPALIPFLEPLMSKLD